MSLCTTTVSHPLNVRPLGQQLLSSSLNLRDAPGALGTLGVLSDELLLLVLGHLEGAELARCSQASQSLRIFSLTDDLWRAALLSDLENSSSDLHFDGSWRRSFVLHHASLEPPAVVALKSQPILYSDAIFSRWIAGTAVLPSQWINHDK